MSNLKLKNSLTDRQLMMVSAEMTNKQKSKVVMWILWLFLGGIGGHRYYLGDIGRGILMTITIGGLGIWTLIDAFFIGKRLQEKNDELEKQIILEMKAIES